MPSATSFEGEIALVTNDAYMTGSVVTADGGMSLSAL